MGRMAKRYRLLRRSDDGTAVYSSYSDEGSEQLTVYPDGRKFRHVIQGINLAKAWALGTAPAPVVVAAPDKIEVEPDAPARVAEPESPAEPAPEPEPDSQIHRDSKAMARSLWLHSGGQRRNLLLNGISYSRQTELLGYAAAQGWITFDEDVVTKGPNQPLDLMPVQEVLSERERELRWGPGEELPLEWVRP
jgi:hypothetical protein